MTNLAHSNAPDVGAPVPPSPAELHGLLDHAPFAALLLDAKARVLHVNAVARKWSADLVLPAPLPAFLASKFPSASRDELLRRAQRTLTTGASESTPSIATVAATPEASEYWAWEFRLLPTTAGTARLVGYATETTAQVRQEMSLRASEEQLQSVFHQAAVGIALSQLDGRFELVNARFAEILGWRPSELHGRSIQELTHPDDRAHTRAAIEQLLTGARQEARFEKRYFRPDGTIVWCRTSGSLQRDRQGRPTRLIGAIEDITERKRAEVELRESETRFRQLADSMPQIVWAARPDGIIDYYNQRWYDYTGLDVEPAHETSWHSVLHPEDLPLTIARWQAALQDEQPYQMEFRYRRRTGEYRWHLGRALPVRDDSGQIVRWFGTSTDIHEHKLTADALREESAITERLNEVARALSTELELDSVVQLITDASTRLTRAQFGAFFYNVADERGGEYMLYALSGVPRKAFADYPNPRATQLFGATFRGEGVIRAADIRQDPRFGKNPPHHGMPRGHLPVVSYLALPVISRTGEVLGGLFFGHAEPGVFTARDERIMVGVAAQAAAAMDVARAYQAEQRARAAAEQASRAKDQFIAKLSHELRTPLTPVLAILAQLQSESSLPGAVQADLQTVRRNVELEARLIDDLLDLTRIAQGKLELHIQEVPLLRTLEDAITTCLPELQQKRLNLTREFDQRLILVQADEARLTQVLWNLLKNAIKFTPENGSITVRLLAPSAERPSTTVEVSDTGIGIEAAALERIFDAFEQGNRAITRQFGGLGLGLAISKAIVEAHGGRLTAASPGLGQGSTFNLSLPNMANPPPPPPITTPAAAAATPVPARGWQILLVEDHEDSAIVFVRLLRRAGHEVRHGRNLAEARALAREMQQGAGLHLLISDLGLPDGSGLELMQELRGQSLRGIALSGYGMDSDRAQTAAAGFDRHLIKPVNPTLLVQTIAELMADA